MKVVGRSAQLLFEGDKVSLHVTHEIKIGRESSWVNYGAETTVHVDEDPEKAKDRVIKHVDSGVMQAIETVVSTIQARE